MSRSRRRSQSFHGMICDEDGKARPCHHNHRTHEAAQECSLREERRRTEAVRAAEVQLISGMSGEEYLRTEEYLRAAKADPVCKERLRRPGRPERGRTPKLHTRARGDQFPVPGVRERSVRGCSRRVRCRRHWSAVHKLRRPAQGQEGGVWSMRTGPEASERHHRPSCPPAHRSHLRSCRVRGGSAPISQCVLTGEFTLGGAR
jgi:hypothetical protein